MASIQTRRNASGETVYRVLYRMDGKQTSRTFARPGDAQRFARRIAEIGAVAASAYQDALTLPEQDTSLTVAGWVERHIEALSGVTPGTRADYRSYLAADIAPTLGELPLAALTRESIGAWVNALAGRGLSGKSIANRHSLLSAALTSAVRAGHIPTNHAKGIRLPRTEHLRIEMVILDAEECNALLAGLEPRWRPLVATMLLTGLRWGEVTALTVGHIDLGRAVLHVRQAWKRTGTSEPQLGPPKSRRGIRTVSLSGAAVAILREQCAGRPSGEWVFPGPDGGPLRHHAFYDYHWTAAVALLAGDYCDLATRKITRGQGKRPRIHDLRHTHASTLIATGVPLTHLQRRLGHESISTTSDTYGHLLPGAHEEMAAAVSIGFSGLDTTAVGLALSAS